MFTNEYDSRLQLAKTIARQAGQLTLSYFQTDRFQVTRKPDGSPLTEADQESETFLREEIEKTFPGDAIVGEEFGMTPGSSGFCWALDPIDGTKSFISGVPLYGTLVAVLDERDPPRRKAVVGACYIPGLDEGIFAASGQGAWHFRGAAKPVRAQVSQTSQLSESLFVTTGPETFIERDAADQLLELSRSAWFGRTWGDAYGYLLVATGRADFMVDPVLNVWDAAAVQVIVEEAGGNFTDWLNNKTFDNGDTVASNGLLHDAVLMILKNHRKEK